MTGTVKWWNDSLGYGMLTTDDGADVFAHYTSLEMEGFKTLQAGDKVEFSLNKIAIGLEAVNVKKIN